ncbi:MAG: DeoR/GlpR transcriptional regulator [Ardenticatenaceae bacterium]|nr:DeoR/GlpR transcriptional regulator [Ardenticatenaceae bacterium]MCB9445614.1 DeoR/GlpR transcriptional regulator [Ardenticatenaceae bacterium]
MGMVERHEQIMQLMLQQPNVTVSELSDRFSVSPVTIRSDLNQLAERGKVVRTHGGARLGDERTRQEYSITFNQRIRAAEKQAIGKLAASLVQPGESILLDASTTAIAVGKALKQRTDLYNVTVITTGIWTALETLGVPHLEVVLTGGRVRSSTGSITGLVANDVLSRFCFHKAFLGAWGISLEGGLMDSPLIEVEIKKAVLPRCQEVIAVVDGSKFGRTSLATIAPLSDVSCIVTDKSAPPQMLKAFQAQGVEILVAEDDK